MTTTKKMTNKVALTYAIEHLTNAPSDVLDKLNGMVAQIEKKNAAPKKLTATQKENEGIKDAIESFLLDNEGKGFTVSDLIKSMPECEGFTTQKVSALMRALVADKRAESYSEKRRTYFRCVPFEEEEEG